MRGWKDVMNFFEFMRRVVLRDDTRFGVRRIFQVYVAFADPLTAKQNLCFCSWECTVSALLIWYVRLLSQTMQNSKTNSHDFFTVQNYVLSCFFVFLCFSHTRCRPKLGSGIGTSTTSASVWWSPEHGTRLYGGSGTQERQARMSWARWRQPCRHAW